MKSLNGERLESIFERYIKARLGQKQESFEECLVQIITDAFDELQKQLKELLIVWQSFWNISKAFSEEYKDKEQVSEGFDEITKACGQSSRMIYQDVRRILKHHSNHPETSSKVLEHLTSLEKEKN